MAEAFDLEEYSRFDSEFPTTAWRVTYPGTQTKRCPDTNDLIAPDTERVIYSKEELVLVTESHFDLKSPEKSCFVSVFYNKQRALNWAGNRGPHDNVFITEIDLSSVPQNIQ